ncbi:MAG: hypothetical protein ABFC84_04900 [Veillonellales bacterium]
MAEFKHHMFQRLHSARQWLNRAEESFDKDRDIRAELDLMLAQAELQHVKEASRSRQWRYKYPLLRQGLAFGLALTVISAGIGGASYFWHQQQSVLPVPIAVQENSRPASEVEPGAEHAVIQPKPAASAAAGSASVVPKAAAVSSAPEQAGDSRVSDNRRSEPQVTRPAEKQVTLSPEEMQQLVRAAGKSLRGQ